MAAVVQYRPYQPKPQQNTLAAFLLAVMMHGVLVGALWLNIQWNVEPAGEVVAELWGTVPPPPEVAPPPKPEPAPAPPPKPIEPPKKSEADIALEEEKKRLELERAGQERLRQAQIERLERERQEREKREQELRKQAQLEKEKLERERAEKARIEQERLEKERLEKERIEKERLAKARAEQERREKLEAEQAQKRRDELREAERNRMLAQAGVGKSGGNPNAAASGGGGRGDGGYAAQLVGLIRPKIIFAVPDNTSPSVYAEYQVDLLPTGEIQAIRLLKASGLPGYDAAVERAIRRTDPFPRKRDGSAPDRTIVIRFRPVDTQ